MIKNTTYAGALRWASAFLKEKGYEERAAEVLLLGSCKMDRTRLMMKLTENMPPDLMETYVNYVNCHSKGKPVQYILGYEMFYGRRFMVTEEVLIPRPETEELVQGVLERINKYFPPGQELNLLDIGTGSGAISVTLALENRSLKVMGTDIAQASLDVAARNAEQLGAQVQFVQGNLFEAIPPNSPNFQVLVSNPPYIPSHDVLELDELVGGNEPIRALDGGEDGLDFYREIISKSCDYLSDESILAFEVGVSQGNCVKRLISKKYPNSTPEVVYDINGKDRMVFAKINK